MCPPRLDYTVEGQELACQKMMISNTQKVVVLTNLDIPYLQTIQKRRRKKENKNELPTILVGILCELKIFVSSVSLIFSVVRL